ncbi:uncharacterized protein LOC127259532 [Andrographis paniculata]|uniref:uncharacterized protein LOC127259532 n=1 Tax=Andrographis paniculata TaxID=175694 RepID=UPI0021E76E29|nr:uncharacterized protein LOC127259532 [Andrographis paniculata]
MEIGGSLAKKNMKKQNRSMRRKQNQKLFAILLAACCSESRDPILIKKCLNELLRRLPRAPLSPFLSLLPELLKSNYTEIQRESLEIIGAAAIASIEMNEKVAMEDEIVEGLISNCGSTKPEIAMAACNAMLDLSTASIGRRRLVEFSAIKSLLLCFIQESETPVSTVSLAEELKLIEEDEYRILLLRCAITLVNSCSVEELHHIPTKLSEKFTELLKLVWRAAHRQQLCSISSGCDQIRKLGISISSLAESIFRLSLKYDQDPRSKDFENVKKSIFDSGEVSIEQFLSEIWEVSPMLIANISEAAMRSMFSPFVKYLGRKEEIPKFITSMLKDTISCPAMASDDLDIIHVIDELKKELGCRIVYNQDIRVVKTSCGGRESHYFQNQFDSSCTSTPHVFGIDDLKKCEEAFNQGYSIALRGVEFRFQSIATIANGLASLFGQPSAGVNMYLTPSNSQGLARHSDDHCVFVCQLIGEKKWTIFPRSNSQLPRLYEPFESLHDLGGESPEINGCRHFLLKEGDVLYIPRGFPHEARTGAADDQNIDENIGFSLHLTLSVEVEPPFEWEGFMQVAMHCWDKKVLSLLRKSNDSMEWNLHVLAVRLMHVAIKLIGDSDLAFRKACLVGATALPSYKTHLSNNQNDVFKNLVDRIANEARFSDALRHTESAARRNEDPLEHIKWIAEMKGPESSNISSLDCDYNPELSSSTQINSEAAFLQVQGRFCNEIRLEEVEQQYKALLEKYKKVRRQYNDGMLSLHSAITSS